MLGAAVGALLLLGAGPASASTIVFQCGGAVCAVDPDVGGSPRQLAAAGRVAGITRDGVTASWVDAAGALVKAPVAGGAPQPIPFTGEVVNQPLMSPDGTKYLWWYPGPDGLGGLNGVWVRRLTVGAGLDRWRRLLLVLRDLARVARRDRDRRPAERHRRAACPRACARWPRPRRRPA